MPRTEGDTWDLASSVGATATSVAATRAFASRGPDPLIDDPYAETLVEAAEDHVSWPFKSIVVQAPDDENVLFPVVHEKVSPTGGMLICLPHSPEAAPAEPFAMSVLRTLSCR